MAVLRKSPLNTGAPTDDFVGHVCSLGQLSEKLGSFPKPGDHEPQGGRAVKFMFVKYHNAS